MTIDLWFVLALGLLGFGAGLIGALLGLGGGIFLVPALTQVLGLPFQLAVGTSLVAVAATSAAGASTYVRVRLTNVRLAVLLSTATVAAAIGASLVAQAVDGRILRVLFAVLLVYTAASMVRGAVQGRSPVLQTVQGRSPVLQTVQGRSPVLQTGRGWAIAGSYEDRQYGRVAYTARRIPLGLGVSLIGGVLSGLLGVGGGIVQVPVMHLLMGVPLKVATGTSSFLIGITAAASALIYYANGRIDPLVAAPAALAVFGGARLGAALTQRLPGGTLRQLFAGVALLVAGQMVLQVLGACPWCPAVR